MKGFFDNVLRKKFRDAVAHFVTEDGVLQISSAGYLQNYDAVAFIADLCARGLIASHERLLAQLERR